MAYRSRARRRPTARQSQPRHRFDGINLRQVRGAEREADSYEAQWLAEQKAHAVTIASVDRLTDAVDADNAEDEARAAVYQNARVDAARAQERLAGAYRGTQATIDALRAAVGQNQAGGCATPDDVQEAL